MATPLLLQPLQPLLTPQEIVAIGNDVAWKLAYDRREAERLGAAWYQLQPHVAFCALSSAVDLREYVLSACDAYQAGGAPLRVFETAAAPAVPVQVPGALPTTIPAVAPPTVPVVADSASRLDAVMSGVPRLNAEAEAWGHADEADGYVRMLYTPLERLGLGWGDLVLACLYPLSLLWDGVVDAWTMFRAEPIPTLTHWAARLAVRLGLVRVARKVVGSHASL